MLNRNSNSSTRKSQIPRGRKIENNHNVHILSKGHVHSDDHQKKSQELQDIDIYEFKKPLKSNFSRNKENVDHNIPVKKPLGKVESLKNVPKLKKVNVTAKSILGHKKVDSARSSLSKRTKSQTHIGLKKQNQSKKSLSPKSNRGITSRTIKPLLTQREKTLKSKTQIKSKKSDTILNNSKNNRKKKETIEPLLILNDSSIDIAKQLENIHKNQMKGKKESKKSLAKPDKKVIVSEVTHRQRNNPDSERERDSPDLITLTHKFKNSKKIQPVNHQIKPKIKDISRVRRQRQTQAAIIIQRAFRNHLQIRNIQIYEHSAITIQRWWRSYLRTRQSFDLPRLVAESSLVTIHDFNYQSDLKTRKRLEISLIHESKDQNLREKIKCLLEQKDSSVESVKHIKTKRIDFSPIHSYDAENDENPRNLPLKVFSPRQLTNTDSEDFLQNLSNLQKVHKQKLLRNYNSQKQNIVRLWEQKLFSPRAQEGKLKDLDNRLNKQLLRFEAGIKEVLRGLTLSKKQHLFDEEQYPQYLNSPPSQTRGSKLNTSLDIMEHQSFTRKQIKEIEDLSVQLQYSKDDSKETKPSQLNFDPSLQGIQLYVSGIFEQLESSQEWRQEFYQLMKRPRGITMEIIISNLDYIEGETESTFKLPIYKEYQDQLYNIVTNERAEIFNELYLKMREEMLGSKGGMGEYEYFHIQAVVDGINQELNDQRVKNSLTLNTRINRFECPSPEHLSKSLSRAKEGLLKNASYLCGFIDDSNELQETYLSTIKEQRLIQMIYQEMKGELQNSTGQQQLIQVKVYVGENIVLEIFQEAILDLFQLIRAH